MESKNDTTYKYNIEESANRMDDILNANDNVYIDNDSNIPVQNELTYSNGYYVKVTALFIDIVDSSELTDGRKRPTVAKMYRAFLSECVAIMNSRRQCKEISINGDCVWGVFETPQKDDIDDVLNIAAQLNGMIKILNYKLCKRGYDNFSVGIGIDFGRVLMVKAGYSGSGINEVVWVGEAVNKACHLSNKAGRDGYASIMVTDNIYNNLSKQNKELFESCNITGTEYEYDIVDSDIMEWYQRNCI